MTHLLDRQLLFTNKEVPAQGRTSAQGTHPVVVSYASCLNQNYGFCIHIYIYIYKGVVITYSPCFSVRFNANAFINLFVCFGGTLNCIM